MGLRICNLLLIRRERAIKAILSQEEQAIRCAEIKERVEQIIASYPEKQSSLQGEALKMWSTEEFLADPVKYLLNQMIEDGVREWWFEFLNDSLQVRALTRALMILAVPGFIEQIESLDYFDWAEEYFAANPRQDEVLSCFKRSLNSKKWQSVRNAAIRDFKEAKQCVEASSIRSFALQGEDFLRQALQIFPQSAQEKEYDELPSWDRG